MTITSHDTLLSLSGKTAIVTGGSLGIGYAISYRLAEAGANVMIANRNDDEGKKAASELVAKGWKAQSIKADVSNEEDVKQVVTQTVSAFGSIDILVNCAGIYPFSPLADMTSELFDKVIAVNLRGVFLTVKYVSEQMKVQGKGGKIINITSVDALHPAMVGLSHYDASKHGVWGFTKNVALELAKYNIWVNAVAPGSVFTPGASQGKLTSAERNPEPQPFDKAPMRRTGTPDDIGKVTLFLASDMSSYMTGSQIVVDGGWLLL